MGTHDLHLEAFDEGTKEKLAIYSMYLLEFLLVFLHARIPRIQIFDFFAGPGRDPIGEPGSPLLALGCVDKALAAARRPNVPEIRLFFNELSKRKSHKLEACLSENNPRSGVTIETDCKDFMESFEEQYPTMPGCANLVFIDQNGVKHMTRAIFEKLVRLPKTDVIFFVSSSAANRFRNLPEIQDYLPLTDEDRERITSTNAHRIVSSAYRRWIPFGLTYYLGSFSIKKQANVYGLVFGSGHPRGIEKFLQIAWKHGGDANFDVDEDHIDPIAPSLFDDMNKRKKVQRFQDELKRRILSREVVSNLQVLIFSLENGCLASHAKEGLQEMVRDGILPNQSFAVSYKACEAEVRPILYFEAQK